MAVYSPGVPEDKPNYSPQAPKLDGSDGSVSLDAPNALEPVLGRSFLLFNSVMVAPSAHFTIA